MTSSLDRGGQEATRKNDKLPRKGVREEDNGGTRGRAAGSRINQADKGGRIKRGGSKNKEKYTLPHLSSSGGLRPGDNW